MAELLDISNLPFSLQERLKELDDDLEEGDITRKGYDKKRKQLLEPYLDTTTSFIDTGRKGSPVTIQDLGMEIDDVDDTIGEEFSISVRKDAVQAAMQTSRVNGPISSKRSNPANRFCFLYYNFMFPLLVEYISIL